jgi:hypothetical protein
LLLRDASAYELWPGKLLLVRKEGGQQLRIAPPIWRARCSPQAVLPRLHPAESARGHERMPCVSEAAALVRPHIVEPVQPLHMYVLELHPLPRSFVNNPLLLQALVQQHHLRLQRRKLLLAVYAAFVV